MGIHLLLICYLRPTTALSADEQSDTHECLLIHPLVCYEGIVCLQAHNGIHFQHTRGIKLSVVFGTLCFVVISDNQSTKHRVTLFHYVVYCSIHFVPRLKPISSSYAAKIVNKIDSVELKFNNSYFIMHNFDKFLCFSLHKPYFLQFELDNYIMVMIL